MTSHDFCVVSIDSLEDAQRELQRIHCDPKSIPIMAPKAVFKVIQLREIMMQDAIIIKQDMLSVGGEVAIPKDAFSLRETCADILVMGTIAQLRELVLKLRRHYPRIQRIAEELSTVVSSFE